MWCFCYVENLWPKTFNNCPILSHWMQKTTRWGHHVHEYGQSRASSEMTYGTNLLNLFNDNSFNDPSYNYCCI